MTHGWEPRLSDRPTLSQDAHLPSVLHSQCVSAAQCTPTHTQIHFSNTHKRPPPPSSGSLFASRVSTCGSRRMFTFTGSVVEAPLRKPKYRRNRPPTQRSSSREDPFIGLLGRRGIQRPVTFPDIALTYGCRQSSPENVQAGISTSVGRVCVGGWWWWGGCLRKLAVRCLNLNIAVVIWD